MQKFFFSTYQAQTLAAYGVIFPGCYCQALWWLHPFLTTHKSSFQRNPGLVISVLSCKFCSLSFKLLLCIAHLCQFTEAWIICFIDTSTGKRTKSKGAWGWGIELVPLKSLQHAPGWRETAAIPSRWLLCNDLKVTVALIAVGCLCCKTLTAGAVRRPHGRCCTTGQHRTLLYRLAAARLCGKTRAGSPSCALQTDSLPVVQCRQPFVMVS